MRFKLLILGFLFIFSTLFSSKGENRIDSLKNSFIIASSDSIKLEALINISMEYVYSNLDSLFYYGNQAIEICNRKGCNGEKGIVLQFYAKALGFNGQNEKALMYLDSASIYFKQIKEISRYASCLNDKGIIYWYQEDYDSATYYLKKSLSINIGLRNKHSVALNFINLGNIHAQKDEYADAIFYYKRAQRVFEDIGDEYNQGTSLINMAYVHYLLGNYNESEVYTLQCLEISKRNNFVEDIANCYNSLGTILHERDNNFDSAMLYFNKAYNIAKDIGDAYGKTSYLISIAKVHESKKHYEKAITIYTRVINMATEIKDHYTLLDCYFNLGEIYFSLKEFEQSKSFMLKAYELSIKIESKDKLQGASFVLAKLFENKGDYINAFKYGEIAYNYKDSVLNQEKIKEITRLEMQFEFDRIQELQQIEKTKQDELYKLKIKNQQKTKNYLLLGLLLLTMLLIVAVRNYLLKKKAHNHLLQKSEIISQQKAEIEAQTDNLAEANYEIVEQKEKLEYANKHLQDSILYARNIQMSMIGDEKVLDSNVQDYFIFWKPLDVVSGDFYWIKKVQNKLIIAVADCTGHGVPGALLSITGISLLNEVVGRRSITTASDALNDLRSLFKSSLKQNEEGKLAKDGMEMALCIIDTDDLSMQFAAAYHSILILKKNTNNEEERIILKGDRQPVSFHPLESKFTNYNVELESGDRLYLFTDGFPDQFGGTKGKKFGRNNLFNLLEAFSGKSMKEQKKELKEVYAEWTQKEEYQIDDILVMGIKL